MIYLLFIAAILCNAVQNIFMKKYSTTVMKANICIFTSLVSAVAMLFFVLTSGGKISYKPEVLVYSVAFAISYLMGMIGNTTAIGCGSLAISTLINQCSLIIPTMYGIVILKEDISVWGYLGIILVFICLFLVCPASEKSKDTKRARVSHKWFFWVTVGFVGCGLCATFQSTAQLKFNGIYKNEFMISALLIVAVISFIAGVINSTDLKKDIVAAIKFAPFTGIANGATNLLVMILAVLVPTAVLFPVIMVGAIVVTFAAAVTFFRERFTKKQLVGYLLGAISIVLINL